MIPRQSPLASTGAHPASRSDGALAAWLRHAAQCQHGPHAGAIAGCISVSGTPSYVYPEIAGYYLTWLSWRAQRSGADEGDAERARGVQRWLGKWLAMPSLPTRVHFDGTSGDWRNQALFCFDLAMVLRGLGSAGQAGLLSPDPAVVDGVCRALSRLVGSDGALVACVPNGAAGGTIPDRWSTRRGPFLAKAAAGVLRAAKVLDIPSELVVAAEQTFAASLSQLAREPHRETHPLLYAFEGVLDMPRHPRFHDALPSISAQFDMLLAYATHDSHLPETLCSATGSGPARIDVMAQTLRVGYLLAAHRPQQPPDRVGLARLRQSLSRHIRPNSGVAFARSASPGQANVWATMFADQALAFASPARGPDAWWRSDPLIV